jgi:hypothetical protein
VTDREAVEPLQEAIHLIEVVESEGGLGRDRPSPPDALV